MTPKNILCEFCGKEFISRNKMQRFCCFKHKQIAQRRRHDKSRTGKKQQKERYRRKGGKATTSYYVYKALLLEILGTKCSKCNNNNGKIHLHHRIPIALGGKNVRENIVLLCEKCHKEVHNEKF